MNSERRRWKVNLTVMLERQKKKVKRNLLYVYIFCVNQFQVEIFTLTLVKQFLIKGYLSIYNIIQGIAFFYITFYVVIKLFYRGKGQEGTI